MREGEILKCVDNGYYTVNEIVGLIYKRLPEKMHKAAARSVLAHLEYLLEKGQITIDETNIENPQYRIN